MIDRYLQPDGKTLDNKLGITGDPEELAHKEAVYVASRTWELRTQGLPQATGFELVKAVHRYLFQDVYPWAGQTRETDLARAAYADDPFGNVQRFTPPHQIEATGRHIFADLAAMDELRNLARERFIEELSAFFTRLNQLHPFREGNGRTQRIIWEYFAKRAGHEFSFEGISRERMAKVCRAGAVGYQEPVRRMLVELLDPIRSAALRAATRFLEKHRTKVDWQDRYVATTEPGQSYAGTFVGAEGLNFMMHDGQNIYIGNLADLPVQGRHLERGKHVTFRAADLPEQKERAPEGRTVQRERPERRDEEQERIKKLRDRGRSGGFER